MSIYQVISYNMSSHGDQNIVTIASKYFKNRELAISSIELL